MPYREQASFREENSSSAAWVEARKTTQEQILHVFQLQCEGLAHVNDHLAAGYKVRVAKPVPNQGTTA